MSLAAARLDVAYEEEIIFEFKDVLASDSEYAEWKDFTNAFGDRGMRRMLQEVSLVF